MGIKIGPELAAKLEKENKFSSDKKKKKCC